MLRGVISGNEPDQSPEAQSQKCVKRLPASDRAGSGVPVIAQETQQVIRFVVEGTARPQGSKRHVGNGIMIESSKHVASWRNWVRMKASQTMQGRTPLTGPLIVSIAFGFDRPKKHFLSKGLRPDAPTMHQGKPDIDKLLRAVLDALTGVVFTDDSQVASIRCHKRYEITAKTVVEVCQWSVLNEES